MVHSHPDKLNGTKFFTWGFAEHGTFQQDFMSASDYQNERCSHDYYDPWCAHYAHEGLYSELQIGPALTQRHTFALPANSTFEWTEWFQAWQADPGQMHAADYSVPLAAAKAWLASAEAPSQAQVDAADAFLSGLADVPPTPEQIVSEGMPWGGLHEQLTGSRLAAGCPFPPPARTPQTAAWLDLLELGTFSAATLAATPTNFEVSAAWIARLEASLAAGHATWLHFLFLGTAALERGDAARGAALLRRSMALQPSTHAARALAFLAPTADEAAALLERAWALAAALDAATDPAAAQLRADVASECTRHHPEPSHAMQPGDVVLRAPPCVSPSTDAAWLLGNERWAELSRLVAALGATEETRPLLRKDKVLHARAGLHVERGEYVLSRG